MRLVSIRDALNFRAKKTSKRLVGWYFTLSFGMDVFIGLCFPFFSRSSSLSFPSSSRASSSFLTCSNICILANFFRAKVSKVRANSLFSSASTMANCFNSISVHFLSQTSGRFFPFLAAAILFPWSLDCMQLLTLKCVSLSASCFYIRLLKRLRRLIHLLSASIGRT